MTVTIGRRELLAALGGAAIAWPLAARAQQQAMPVVGFLDVRSPDALGGRLRAFHQGLKLQAAAGGMGLQIDVLNANSNREINAAFEKIGSMRPDALFVAASSYLNGRHVQLVQLAAFHRLPAAYALRESAEVGGLISYGTNIADAFRQIGVYAGRILKGAKPADLPVVQASKFELIINAQTATMLGLTVPDKLLAVADEVIK